MVNIAKFLAAQDTFQKGLVKQCRQSKKGGKD